MLPLLIIIGLLIFIISNFFRMSYCPHDFGGNQVNPKTWLFLFALSIVGIIIFSIGITDMGDYSWVI